MDIGAHDPYWLSNTYLFYKNKSKGVLIEPDRDLYKRLKKNRPRDIVLNIGLGKEKGRQELFLMNQQTLNTFSREESEKNVAKGYEIKEVREVWIDTFNNIVNEYLGGSVDFVSLDVEGMEMDILETINFKEIRPRLFCIENKYGNIEKEGHDKQIYDLMKKNGYSVYSYTPINVFYSSK